MQLNLKDRCPCLFGGSNHGNCKNPFRFSMRPSPSECNLIFTEALNAFHLYAYPN
jgi:hypothetical protein